MSINEILNLRIDRKRTYWIFSSARIAVRLQRSEVTKSVRRAFELLNFASWLATMTREIIATDSEPLDERFLLVILAH